jgi:hypothetical protein
MDPVNYQNSPVVIEQWLRRGTLPGSYIASVLGDQSRAVSTSNPEIEVCGRVIVEGTPISPNERDARADRLTPRDTSSRVSPPSS